ncbi:MAG: hypothetical protein H7175_28185, partial [Burkholderiales bacterium]|nr:hypothetical protein [Anaerolineae bacterium]
MPIERKHFSTTLLLILTAFAIFALFPQTPTAAQDTDASSTPDVTTTSTAIPATSTNPLLDMLALVPESALDFGDPPHIIRYGDFAALEATHHISPDSADEFAALNDSERSHWTNGLMRMQALPPYILNNTYQRIAEMPTLVGFEWFDIDQVLTFANLPFAGMIYAGDFDPASIETALTEREFGVTEYEGVTIWNRGGDGMTDITLMSLGDPFGGDVGWTSRIAVMPSEDGTDYLAN